MRVLFVARHFTYFRNFDSVIRMLAERGHAIHLAVERSEALGGSTLVEQIAANHPNVTFGDAPSREADDWARIVTKLRLSFDYLRYLDPAYDTTPRLRSRAAERAPAFVVRFGASRWSRVRPVRTALRRALRSAEAGLPGSASIEAFLREQRPDVLLVTPLLGVVGSPQPDYVRAARALGIPAALCVWSWDHLSSKALIRDVPDRVLVWNEVQRDEAVRLHAVPPERVVVTGAQCFDHWFERRPSRSRDQFCVQTGLDPARPVILYVGSALFGGSPSEAAFVMRWIEYVRSCGDDRLRSAGILVRPHPQRTQEWDGIDLGRFTNVAVWGGNPVTEQARADYFDSLFHSTAVVGLNTSAFLEAGIAGRPVFAILPPEFRDNQEGTIHFHYLTTAGGGLLRVSRTFDDLARQLGAVLEDPPAASVNAPFVQAFIRPHGLDVSATPVFASAVERLAGVSVPAGLPAPSLLGRTALRAFLAASASPRWQAWTMDEEDRVSAARRQMKANIRAEQRRASEQALAAKREEKLLTLDPEIARKKARAWRTRDEAAGRGGSEQRTS